MIRGMVGSKMRLSTGVTSVQSASSEMESEDNPPHGLQRSGRFRPLVPSAVR
jgi:hypothetical protein